MSDDLIERLEKRALLSEIGEFSRDAKLFAAAAARIRDLESRLATAEADAMERAARVLARASEEIRSLKPKAD